MSDPDVVVVGGGIGGLTCAAFLARQGIDVELLERNDRLGGLARSVKVDDWLIPANLGRTDGFAEGDPKIRILGHLELLDRLRRVPESARIPVMVLTGYVDAAERARAAGAQEVIVKPFDRKVFVAKVMQLLVENSSGGPSNASTATS